MTDQVPFYIPADFILSRCVLTEEEIHFGIRHRWLSQEDADTLVAALGSEYHGSMTPVDEITPLSPEKLAHEQTELYDVVQALEASGEWADSIHRLWQFLALDWLYLNRKDHKNPLQLVADIYCEFAHPKEIQSLVHWMPATEGKPAGAVGLEEKWRGYLESTRLEYAHRSSA